MTVFQNTGCPNTLNEVSGVFVEIGLVPSTKLLRNIVKLSEIGKIITNPKTQETSNIRIWAAGDCKEMDCIIKTT